jgi:hypothetical protein
MTGANRPWLRREGRYGDPVLLPIWSEGWEIDCCQPEAEAGGTWSVPIAFRIGRVALAAAWRRGVPASVAAHFAWR